jgi:GNAT superfamily N-acetyltransferase
VTRYSIRVATVRDLDALVRHRRGMWEDIGGYEAKQLDAHDRLYRRWAREKIRTGKFIAWVAVRGGEVVASGAVWLQPTQPHPKVRLGPVPYLLSMYTEPEHRGNRLASRIVLETMRWARTEGYPRMTLHASDMGRNVYSRVGWKRTWEMRAKMDREPPRKKGPHRPR